MKALVVLAGVLALLAVLWAAASLLHPIDPGGES